MYALSKQELIQRQELPLNVKIKMTERRINEFIDMYGTDCVYISFSGGKDSTVLMDITRKLYSNITAVFCDTWLEYPQIRQFVKTFDNVEVLKPEKSMKQIIEEYGWNFPSKDVAEAVFYARQGKQWAINKLQGLDKDGNNSEFRQMYKKWFKLIDAPFKISNRCCLEMKEKPISLYEKRTGRKPLLALMAEESSRRKEAYMRTGCNSFDGSRPMSKPIGFWKEQDVLQYIKQTGIRYASVYGDIVENDPSQVDGQVTLECGCCQKLKTTGEQRTGCTFCPVGCHLDNFAKFRRLKEMNPKLYDYCMNELGLSEVVDWIKKNY